MDVKCSTCKKQVEWNSSSKWKPFCSERCRLIDLGQWASEEHRIPGEQVEQTTEPESPTH